MNSDDLRKLIQQKMSTSPSLRSVMKRIQSGKATFKDSAEYSRIFSELVGRYFSENVLSLTDREAVAEELLRGSYGETNSVLGQVQRSIDRKNGLNIRPQTAAFPLERVQQFAHSLVDPTVEDSVIQRRARSGTANISMSFHDDYIRENAQFRNDAGLKCYITRETDGKCCKWCTAIAGRYVYGEEPHDVYRRHDNCGCSVIYENGRQRQDVWSKRTWETPKVGAGADKPKVLSRSQGRELEQGKLAQIRGLKFNSSSIDNSGGSGIINIRGNASSEIIEWFPKGEKISVEDFKELREYAKSKGILLQGFKTSDVDINLIKKSIDSITQVTDIFPELKGNEKKSLTLLLSDTMKANDFASTDENIGHIIKLNADAFRNSEKLEMEYQKLVNDKWFVQGTDSKAIVKHELGHLYQTVHNISDDEIMKIAMNSAGIDDKKALFSFLDNNLSKYSGSYKDGSEIISEVFSDYFGSKVPSDFSKKFMSELIGMR